MDSNESWWYCQHLYRALLSIFFLYREKMAPKVGTVVSKIEFSRFRENRDSNLEFSGMLSYPFTRSLSVPSFIALRSAVWPVGRGQTNTHPNKPGGAEDLSCLRRLGTRNHVPKRRETSFARLRRNEFIFTHESTRNFIRANGSMSASRSALISKFEGCQREILNR